MLAAARLFAGRPDETEAYIEVAERLAETVPEERRRRFDLRVASTKLWLARRRVDLATALEAKREVEAALAAQSASDIARVADHRAAAVMNVGITELWSLRTDEARRHLEEALSLAQQAERPYLEISCLAHLGIAGPDGGGSVLDGVHYAEQAIARAEALGWGEEAIITPGARDQRGRAHVAGPVRRGRASAGARRPCAAARGGPDDHAHRALGDRPAAPDPGSASRRRWRDFAEAQRLSSPMGKEVRTIEPRGVMLQTQVRMGEAAEASAALAELDEDERDRALVRIAAAEIHLAQDDPEAALEVLAPVIEGSSAGGSLDDVADRRAAVRRAGPGQARRRSRDRGGDRAGARARRARGDHRPLCGRAGRRAAGAPSTASHGPRRAALGDPRRAQRLRPPSRPGRRGPPPRI